MELDLLLASSFVILAQEKHFGHAATRLHVTSSGLTKRIQRLERQVGTALIERGPAGICQITPAGRRFADAAPALLAHAAEVQSGARDHDQRCTVRIGFPAGSLAGLSRHIPFTAIARQVRLDYPEARFVCREIPFAELGECLPDGHVDVLWTSAPVHRSGVESFPLRAGSGLIGVVAAHHPLADAGSMEVSGFCTEPMLYNPTAPDEWMRKFWLAEIRSRRDARLVETYQNDHAAVLREVASGAAVMTTVALAHSALGPRLRPVTLLGAPRLRMHAARRRAETRGAVQALIAAFDLVPADACP
jgi:DNA-binding transcriptional LysR family regulator